MAEVEYRTIYERSAPKAVLLQAGQLQPGQSGFASDTNEIIYRKRLNAPVNPGGYVVFPVPVSPSWNTLADKPTTFPPSAHQHAWSDIGDLPLEFPPEYHQHAIADLPNLGESLQELEDRISGKLDKSGGIIEGDLLVTQGRVFRPINPSLMSANDWQWGFDTNNPNPGEGFNGSLQAGIWKDGDGTVMPGLRAYGNMMLYDPRTDRWGSNHQAFAYQSDLSSVNQEAQELSNALALHVQDFSNPHQVTKSQLGLNNVDNTADIDKPISTEVANALAGKLSQSMKGVANGLATLDSSGLIPSAQLPPIAIHDTFTASSDSAMLALVAQRGDVCVRSDQSKTYILSAEPASTLANWVMILTPTNFVNGSMTAGSIPKATGSGTLGDSALSEDAAFVMSAKQFKVLRAGPNIILARGIPTADNSNNNVRVDFFNKNDTANSSLCAIGYSNGDGSWFSAYEGATIQSIANGTAVAKPINMIAGSALGTPNLVALADNKTVLIGGITAKPGGAQALQVSGGLWSDTIYRNGTELAYLFSQLGHAHDDRYYTEAEVDSYLSGKESIHTRSTITAASDLDSYTSPGTWAVSNAAAATKFPAGAYGWGVFQVHAFSSGSLVQLYFPHRGSTSSSSGIYFRVSYTGTFTTWQRLFGDDINNDKFNRTLFRGVTQTAVTGSTAVTLSATAAFGSNAVSAGLLTEGRSLRIRVTIVNLSSTGGGTFTVALYFGSTEMGRWSGSPPGSPTPMGNCTFEIHAVVASIGTSGLIVSSCPGGGWMRPTGTDSRITADTTVDQTVTVKAWSSVALSNTYGIMSAIILD